MLRDRDLEGQSTFIRIKTSNQYIDFPDCDYMLCFDSKARLYSHDETDGSLELLCDEIHSLEHLADLYEVLSGKELEK